jgi:Ras-related protein Rab-7A
MLSTKSASSSSGVTITPSLFARENAKANGTHDTPSPQLAPAPALALPLPPERGPKLFFTSAKTGEGVADVFEYIAQRVVRKWEYEEWVEARTMHFREASGRETISLGSDTWNRKKLLADCCAS